MNLNLSNFRSFTPRTLFRRESHILADISEVESSMANIPDKNEEVKKLIYVKP